MEKHCKWGEQGVLERVEAALNAQTLVVCSTDTVLGLLAQATAAGKKALDEAKGRSQKPYLLIATADQAQEMMKSSGSAMDALVKKGWPGPLTLVGCATQNAPGQAIEGGAVAVRVPAHAHLLALLEKTGPLFSTSANITGEPIPTCIADLAPQLEAHAALIVEGEQSELVPSTIVDVTNPVPQLIRVGAYSIPLLEKITGMTFKQE